MSVKTDRLASTIQRELAYIVNDVIKNTQIGYLNLTEVKLTNDKSIATVYYTILSDDQELINLSKEVIEKNKSQIRVLLAQKIKDIRKQPDLVFKYDEALAYGNKIDGILKTLK